MMWSSIHSVKFITVKAITDIRMLKSIFTKTSKTLQVPLGTLSKKYFSTGRLSGKTVVVCGAGNNADEEWGVGKYSSILLAREGANVVSVSNNSDHANGTTEIIKKEGNSGLSVTADCTSPEDVQRLLDETMKNFGQVDCLVNAGVYDAQPNGFEKISNLERWNQSMNLNLNAQFSLISTFLPQMTSQDNGGNFIFVSTIAATVGLGLGQQRHGYAAGKAGACTLTRRIGVEYAPQGIRGNTIEAGYIASPLVTRAVSNAGASLDKVTAVRDAYVPRGKQGVPKDVANAVVFLASDDASFINGVKLPVDGGTSSVTYGP